MISSPLASAQTKTSENDFASKLEPDTEDQRVR
jgi:hypothetical protein